MNVASADVMQKGALQWPTKYIPYDLTRAPSPVLRFPRRLRSCLSGGGYRAMLFHVGGLIRINEAGLLAKIGRISSVSGGSITAAVLGLKWSELRFDERGIAQDLHKCVDLIRGLARVTIDVGAVMRGLLLPGTISSRVAAAYDETPFQWGDAAEFAGTGAGGSLLCDQRHQYSDWGSLAV